MSPRRTQLILEDYYGPDGSGGETGQRTSRKVVTEVGRLHGSFVDGGTLDPGLPPRSHP